MTTWKAATGSDADGGRTLLRQARLLPVAPPLLAIAWVLTVVEHADVGFAPAMRSLLAAAVVGSLIGLGCAAALRDPVRGGAIGALLVAGVTSARSPIMWALVLVAIALLLLERWRAQRVRLLPWARIHEGLAVASAVMVVVGLLRVAGAVVSHPAVTYDPAWTGAIDARDPAQNLYLVLVDGHGRTDVLETYGYDAAPFMANLAELGFDVAGAAQSNYTVTRLSLASMLSGSHLEQLGVDLTAPVDDTLVFEAIRQNPTWAFLERAGYRTIVIPSGWDHLPLREVDEYLPSSAFTELEINLIGATSLGGIASTVVTDLWVDAAYRHTLDGLETFRAVAQRPTDQPRAVLLHVPVPHPPFAFRADCSARPPDLAGLGSVGRARRAGTRETEALVVDQTTCVDRLLHETLADVVRVDPTAAVVVFSDHGPEERLDWWEPGPAAIQERHAILFAARTPGYPAPFEDDITLVNLLPELFGSVFGLELPQRDDTLYFGPSQSTGPLVPVPKD